MPFRYPDTARTEILARVAGGETLKGICRGAAMPCVESVTGWMRGDPEFAAEMARARGRGRWVRRRRRGEPGQRAAVLARLAAGEAICDIVRGPAMPSYRTYMRWRREDAAFGAAVQRVLDARIVDGHRHRRRAYDPAVAERIYLRVFHDGALRRLLRSDPTLPSLAVVARWRAEQPEFDAQLRWAMAAWRARRGRERTLCTPQATQRIVDGLVTGGSLRSLSGRPDMPSQRTLCNWVRDRPEFAAEVEQACRDREHWYMDRMQMALDHMTDPVSEKIARRHIMRARQQLGRLRKRPGWKRARAAAADVTPHPGLPDDPTTPDDGG